MFIVYLNVCLDIASRIVIGMVKKTSAENFSSVMIFLICPGFVTDNSRSCERKRHIRKTIEEEKFSAHFFVTVPMKIQIDICRQTLR